MLRLAIVFLILALVAGLFGFGLIANFSYDVAKILFFVFIVLFVLSLVMNLGRGRTRPSDLV
jgi:uncharacterized membrane protein YtjA (UPF0391 family)